MKELKELIERAILVAYWRNGDVDTQDGTYATTETDEMIRLESAIQELFGLEAHDLYKSLNAGQIIEKKLNETINSVVAGMVADSLVITDADGVTVEFDWREGVVELKGHVSNSNPFEEIEELQQQLSVAKAGVRAMDGFVGQLKSAAEDLTQASNENEADAAMEKINQLTETE